MNRSGFTMIEIVLVVVVIGILSTMVLLRETSIPTYSELRARDLTIRSIRMGISEYEADQSIIYGGLWGFPVAMDSNPVDSACETCFSRFVEGGVRDSHWTKTSNSTYVFNNGINDYAYAYNQMTGTFAELGDDCGGGGQPCCENDICNEGICMNGYCGLECGNLGQPCCTGDSCDEGSCLGGICGPVICGGVGQVCCVGNVCDSGATCRGHYCATCGRVAQPCCQPGNICNLDNWSVCSAGTCICNTSKGCGCYNQSCCTGNICYDPATTCKGSPLRCRY